MASLSPMATGRPHTLYSTHETSRIHTSIYHSNLFPDSLHPVHEPLVPIQGEAEEASQQVMKARIKHSNGKALEVKGNGDGCGNRHGWCYGGGGGFGCGDGNGYGSGHGYGNGYGRGNGYSNCNGNGAKATCDEG